MAPRFLDALSTVPRWQKLVLGAFGLAVLGGAGYFLGIVPMAGRVAALRVQRDEQQKEIARMRVLVADLARVRAQSAEVARQLEVAKERLPTEREMPSLYRTLSDAAVQAGLAVTLFQPQPARARDFYSEIPIALVGEGGYHEVGDFVGRVAALPRTTTVSELKLIAAAADSPRPGASSSPGPAGARRPPAEDPGAREGAGSDPAKKSRHSLRAEITLLTYMYRPVGAPPAPKPAASAPKPEAPKP